ncbi:unnamed protein product, partial [Phaeothamnion confervicola]
STSGPTPSFIRLRAASRLTSKVARASSIKCNTRCELLLQRALRTHGLRYRLNARDLPGRPDIVFVPERIAVFCDGDFWHGRRLAARLRKLAKGHNGDYWVQKIRRNVERDRQQTRALKGLGWQVLRIWEGDVLANPTHQAKLVFDVIQEQRRKLL